VAELTGIESKLFTARDFLIQSKVTLGSARVRAYRALGAFDQMK